MARSSADERDVTGMTPRISSTCAGVGHAEAQRVHQRRLQAEARVPLDRRERRGELAQAREAR